MLAPPRIQILAIGETIWDCFPEQKRLGGSPLNFAYICSQLGVTPHLVSAVGNDRDGALALQGIEELGLSTYHILRIENLPTGQATISQTASGSPQFTLDSQSAWDQLVLTKKVSQLAKHVDAVFFGSLCQRSPVSKTSIHTLLQSTSPSALKLFDVNIRSPYFSQTALVESLRLANALKTSDEELLEIVNRLQLKGNQSDQLKQLRDEYQLDYIVLTCGKLGSYILHGDHYLHAPSEAIEVVDTVGAGDSFAATFCTSILKGHSIEETAYWANKVAAHVCTQTGATVTLPAELANPPSLPL